MKSWIALGFAPESINKEANVWRHSCIVIAGVGSLTASFVGYLLLAGAFGSGPGALRPPIDGRAQDGQ